MKILVAEDERKVREFIRTALQQEGMVVDAVTSIPEMLAALSTSSYELIVMDRLLQGRDAIDALPEIKRGHATLKILVLSALAEVENKVEGLREGADDYLAKPFHVTELVARIRSLMRRGEGVEKRNSLLVYEDLRIELETQRVSRAGKRIDLTGKEFRALCLLARYPNQVFSKMKILDQVWDIDHNPGSNVVEVTIANLRAKVDKGSKPLIQNRRGVGYWLGEP